MGSSIVLCQSHWKSLLNFLSVLQRAPLRYTNSFSYCCSFHDLNIWESFLEWDKMKKTILQLILHYSLISLCWLLSAGLGECIGCGGVVFILSKLSLCYTNTVISRPQCLVSDAPHHLTTSQSVILQHYLTLGSKSLKVKKLKICVYLSNICCIAI